MTSYCWLWWLAQSPYGCCNALSQRWCSSRLKCVHIRLIALTAAVIPYSDIYTDCKSALATVMQACSTTSKRSSLWSIRAVVNALHGASRPRIIWKRCHANSSSWSQNDWGIFLAAWQLLNVKFPWRHYSHRYLPHLVAHWSHSWWSMVLSCP